MPFVDNWHIDLLANRLMACAPGGNRRLMINIPPRHLKSFVASVCWPLFMCAHHPGLRICICAGTHDLTVDLDNQRQRLIASKRLRAVFPNLRPIDTPGVLRFPNGSEVIHTNVLRSQIGRGADVFIIDDPLPAADAEKPIRRKAVADWYIKEVLPRLNRKTSSAIIIVMQRLHRDDLCATAAAGGGEWKTLELSAIARYDDR